MDPQLQEFLLCFLIHLIRLELVVQILQVPQEVRPYCYLRTILTHLHRLLIAKVPLNLYLLDFISFCVIVVSSQAQAFVFNRRLIWDFSLTKKRMCLVCIACWDQEGA